jgi:hypothetical protein
MVSSVKQMMEAANAAVPRLTAAQAREVMAKGNTLVVDVRDAPEVEKTGKVAGAVHVSRGAASLPPVTTCSLLPQHALSALDGSRDDELGYALLGGHGSPGDQRGVLVGDVHGHAGFVVHGHHLR